MDKMMLSTYSKLADLELCTISFFGATHDCVMVVQLSKSAMYVKRCWERGLCDCFWVICVRWRPRISVIRRAHLCESVVAWYLQMSAHIGYQQITSVSKCGGFLLAYVLAHIATEQHLTKRSYQLSGEKICVVKGCWTIDGQLIEVGGVVQCLLLWQLWHPSLDPTTRSFVFVRASHSFLHFLQFKIFFGTELFPSFLLQYTPPSSQILTCIMLDMNGKKQRKVKDVAQCLLFWTYRWQPIIFVIVCAWLTAFFDLSQAWCCFWWRLWCWRCCTKVCQWCC